MQTRTIVEYALAALIVIILGAFVGWYFFLSAQSKETTVRDAARGYESGQDNSSEAPSFLSRILGNFAGEGTGVSPSPSDSSFGQSPTSLRATTSSETPPTKRPSQLWHAHIKPVAGMSFVRNGNTEQLRYVERATGYVYEADPETGLVTRVNNTLSPKIYEAVISLGGRIIERSIDSSGHVSSSVGMISASPGAASATTTPTIALIKDIIRLVIDPRSDNIFYLVRDTSGVAGYRSEWNGSKPKQVFSSTILGWNPVWLSDGRIILTQAAASNVPGFAYELMENGELRPLIRGVSGLTLLPRAHGALLFGEAGSSGLSMFAQLSPTTTVVKLPIKTIAEKCAWVPDTITQSTSTGKTVTKIVRTFVAYCGAPQGEVPSNFLDNWYRGSAHTSDTLWRVDANSGNAVVVYNPDSRTSIDVENPIISITGGYMAFMNKTDKSLWVFRIEK